MVARYKKNNKETYKYEKDKIWYYWLWFNG